jgi:hypothetical protein
MKTPQQTEEQTKAYEFFGSMRGQWIVSQALSLAIRSLKQVQPEVMQEQSNISDMQYLIDNLFPQFQSYGPSEEESAERVLNEKAITAWDKGRP